MARVLTARVSDEQYLAFLNEAIRLKMSVSELMNLKIFGTKPGPVKVNKPDKPKMELVKQYSTKWELHREMDKYGFTAYQIEKTTRGTHSKPTKEGYVMANEGYQKIKVYKLPKM